MINDKEVYYLEKGKPTLVSMEAGSTIVASDGFHLSTPLRLGQPKKEIFHVRIQCIMDDDQFIASAILVSITYVLGLTLDILLMKLLSFTPIIVFLYLYYGNRQKFLTVTALH